MEWFGVFAFIMVLAYAGYPNKTKDLEKRLKKLEKKQKGENTMSKLIGDLVDKECVLKTDAALEISGSTKLKCHVLDTDECDALRFRELTYRGVTYGKENGKLSDKYTLFCFEWMYTLALNAREGHKEMLCIS